MADSTGATAKPATSAPVEQKLPPSAVKAVKLDVDEANEAAKTARDEQLQAATDRRDAARDLADRDFEAEKTRIEGEYSAHEDAEKRAKSGDLAPAGESTDPDVHQALAEREIARTNRDTAAEALADRRLALLGVK